MGITKKQLDYILALGGYCQEIESFTKDQASEYISLLRACPTSVYEVSAIKEEMADFWNRLAGNTGRKEGSLCVTLKNIGETE